MEEGNGKTPVPSERGEEGGDVTKVCLLPHPNLQGPSPEAVTTIMGCIFFWSQSKQS